MNELTYRAFKVAESLTHVLGLSKNRSAVDHIGVEVQIHNNAAVALDVWGFLARAQRQVLIDTGKQPSGWDLRACTLQALSEVEFLSVWNDEPARTIEDVRDLFARAAEIALQPVVKAA